MNILFVSDLAGMGGGEVSLLYIMEYLAKEHSVYLLCRTPGTLVERCKEKGITVFCYNFKKNLVKSLLLFKKIIRENKIDVVHNNELTTAILHGLFLKCIGSNAYNYCTCHGQWYKLKKWKRILITKNIRHIFCVSSAVEHNLNNQGVFNTSVSYLGVPEEKFIVDSAAVQCIKEEIGATDHNIVIVTIGRFQEIKGQLKGVHAIKMLHEKYPNILYYLVGDNVFGNEADAQYKKKVQDYISEHHMEDYVKLLGERRDIPTIMACSNYIMITSDNESFGMVAIEAIASGRILISTPCDGVCEILNNDRNMIAETNDSQGLFCALSKYLRNEQVVAESMKQIKYLKKRFTVQAVSQKYLDEYSK